MQVCAYDQFKSIHARTFSRYPPFLRRKGIISSTYLCSDPSYRSLINYRLFREGKYGILSCECWDCHLVPGIEPIWEDPAHTNGKRLQVRCHRHFSNPANNSFSRSSLCPSRGCRCLASHVHFCNPKHVSFHTVLISLFGALWQRCCWTETKSACRRLQVLTPKRDSLCFQYRGTFCSKLM